MGIDYLLGMKKFKTVVLFCILSFAVSCSQQKKYVEYNVKKGETMRTIAKDLDMKTKDLLRLNPDIGRKPAVNTVIIIPNKNTISTNRHQKHGNRY
jgi:LysM repeat protein